MKFLPLFLLVEAGVGLTVLSASMRGDEGLACLASQMGLSAAVTAVGVALLCTASRVCIPIFVLMTWVLADAIATLEWLGPSACAAMMIAAVLVLYALPGLAPGRSLPTALILSVAAGTLADGASEWIPLIAVNLLGGVGGWLRATARFPGRAEPSRSGTAASLPEEEDFLASGERALRRARRQESPFALLLIDVDGFGDLVARHGPASGPLLLQALAMRVRKAVREEDIVGRMGPDELAACLAHADEVAAWTVARRILAHLDAAPLDIGDRDVPLTVSVGIAQCTDDTRDLADLLYQAEAALWSAKQGGPMSIRAGRRLAAEPI